MNEYRTLRRVAFYALLLVDLALSLQPHATVDAMYSPELQSHDLLVHLLAYAALGASAAAAFVRRGPGAWRGRLAAAVSLAALGGVLELLQETPLVGRSCQLSDALHNTAGAFLGAFLLPPFFLLPRKQP